MKRASWLHGLIVGCVVVAATAATAHAQPVIEVFLGAQNVPWGAGIVMPPDTPMTALNLQIVVSNPGGFNTDLSAVISDLTVEGVLESEFESVMAATPYVVGPTTGVFIVPNRLIWVDLTASDGIEVTTFTFAFWTNDTGFNSPTTPIAIPDNPDPGIIDSITVAGAPVGFTSMRVRLDIWHTWIEDLDIWLLPPGVNWTLPVLEGNEPAGAIALSIGNGGNGDDMIDTSFTSPTDPMFSVPGQQSIAVGVAPFTGTFTPQDAAAFGALYGSDPNGTWRLVIYDVFNADQGFLISWSIEFQTGAQPSIAVTTNGNPVANNGTIDVAVGTDLSALDLRITVDDADGQNTRLAASFVDMTTEGLVLAEFGSALAAVAYTLNPTTGTFSNAPKQIVVHLAATDAGGARREFQFTLNIISAPAVPSITVNSTNGPITNNGTVNVPFNATLASLGLEITVTDSGGLPTSLTAVLGGVTTEGILQAEFQSAQAAVPYTRTPSTGTFNANNATITIQLTATNSAAAQATFTFTLQVDDNNAPTISVTVGGNPVAHNDTIPADFLTTLSALNLEITVDDADGENTSLAANLAGVTTEGILQAEFQSAAAGVAYTLSPTSGTFNASNATISISLTADDARGMQSTFAFTIQVSTNQPPTIAVTTSGNPVAHNGTIDVDFNSTFAALSLAIDIDDPEGTNTSISASFAGMSTEGLVQAQFQSGAAGVPYTLSPTSGTFNVPGASITVTLIAQDATGAQTTFAFTIDVGTNLPPTIAVTAGGNPVAHNGSISVNIGDTLASVNLEISIDDADGNATTLSANLAGVTTEGILQAEFQSGAAGVPYTLSPTSGTFGVSGASIAVTLTAQDGFGGQTVFAFTFAVNHAPAISVTRNGLAVAGNSTIDIAHNATLASLILAITVTDADGENTSLGANLAGVTTEGLVQGEFESAQAAVPYTRNPSTGTFNAGNATIVITLTAEDASGNATVFAFTLQVTAAGGGSAPAIVSTAPTNALVNAQYWYQIQATGFPDPSLSVGGLPAWLTFDPVSGVIAGRPGVGDVGQTGQITITATNGVLPDATQTFQITVSMANYAAGDIAIVGVRTTAPAGFAFVTWVALSPAAQIHFTDNSFDGTAFRDTESTMTWTAPALGVPAGTVIVVTLDSPDATADFGACTGTLSLDSVTGDQIFAFEGELAGGANLLYGVNIGNPGWLTIGPANDSNSYLPAELANHNVDVGTLNSHKNAQFASPRNNLASLASYPAVINIIANWVTSNTGVGFVLDSTDFTILGNTLPTITVTRAGTPVADGDVISINVGNPLTALDLAIVVDDANLDSTLLLAAITNITTQGFVIGEWQRVPAAAAPFTRQPITGNLIVTTDHVVSLLADDSNGGASTFTFTIRVVNPTQTPGISKKKGCGVLPTDTAAPLIPVWMVLFGLLVMAVVRRRLFG